MKKFVLIIISVIMLFSACGNQTENITDTTTESYTETSAPKTQIDPAEEFGGITFGMTQDEVISIVGKKPDGIPKPVDGPLFPYYHIEYWKEEHFNVSNADVAYFFEKDTDALRRIDYDYYYDESEQEQFLKDYDVIKEEILRRYPEEIWTYSYNDESDEDPSLTIYTENRKVCLCAFTDILDMGVMIEEYEPIEESIQTQIDPAEEFGGITFGMTKDEIIEFYGEQPDNQDDDTNYVIKYNNETHFNIGSADIFYFLGTNGKLNEIDILYRYLKDSEENSLQADYNSIKEELLKRYPEPHLYLTETEDKFDFATNNRFITLSIHHDPWYDSIRIEIDEK